MASWVWRALVGLSLVLVVCFAWLWVRSYKICDDLDLVREDLSQLEAYTYPGIIHYHESKMPLNPRPGWYWKAEVQTWRSNQDFLPKYLGTRFAGFAYVPDVSPDYDSLDILIPIWMPLALSGTLPLAALVGLSRRRWANRPRFKAPRPQYR